MAMNRASFSNQRGLWMLSRSDKAFAFKNISMKKCFIKITTKKKEYGLLTGEFSLYSIDIFALGQAEILK